MQHWAEMAQKERATWYFIYDGTETCVSLKKIKSAKILNAEIELCTTLTNFLCQIQYFNILFRLFDIVLLVARFPDTFNPLAARLILQNL